MSTIRNNWLNHQASRRYPLDDNSTGTGDDGITRLKDDVIVDLHLRWPSLAGQYAFLGGLTVTENIITAVILAADSPTAASNFTPLASVTVPQPAARHVYYNLEPMYPGAGGFIMFGDVRETHSIRLGTPQQGLLAPKVARPYEKLPIPTMRKLGRVDGLVGLVKLIAGPDLEIVKEEVIVDGESQDAIILRLINALDGRSVLADYIGPCGTRPESRNCIKEGVETVNGVSPDCDGDLKITFKDLVDAPYESCGSEQAGVTLDQSLGLDDVCTAGNVNRFGGEDYCAPSVSSSSAAAPQESSESAGSSGIPSESSEFLPESSESCAALPFLDNFLGGVDSNWVVKKGTFEAISDQYKATDASRRCISLWDNCVYDDASDAKLVTGRVILTNSGAKVNGGLVLNYHIDEPLTNPHTEYFMAMIDRNDNKVQLLRFNGASTITEHAVTPGVPFPLGDTFEIAVELQPSGPNTAFDVTVRNLTNPGWPTVSFSLLTSRYGANDGKHGVVADRAVTFFDDWELENA